MTGPRQANPKPGATARKVMESALTLRAALKHLRFKPPVTHTYNPLEYAWAPQQTYIRRFGNSPKKVLFLGMNPGPFGMMQTGVPFGEINAVRDWMGINDPVQTPAQQHPKKPIDGFNCTRSEVSGRRLWGLFSQRYPNARDFFAHHFVINYCPLVFLEESGRNHTPDKLPAAELKPIYQACDQHLREIISLFQPQCLVGVGAFATKRATLACEDLPVRIGQILHPSPASPAANRDWAGTASQQLQALGIWN